MTSYSPLKSIKPERPEAKQSEKAIFESVVFKKTYVKPNTIVVPLWKNGYISFDPDNNVPIFALLSLIVLIITTIFIVIVGAFANDSQWLDVISTSVGSTIPVVIGAILGSSVPKIKYKTQKNEE